MTQFLPPYLLALFAPRDPVPYLPPLDKLPHDKKRQPYTGLADFLDQFEDPEETPPPVKIETRLERLERKRLEKAEQNAYKLEQNLALWDPQSNANATSNPYKTLFVARINYDTSESKLKREFEVYGKIKQIKLVHDQVTGKPRGYAFIEYEEESSMHAAYKKADGKKIDGRRVVVDVERGRTIKGWKPRRLGGGKGGRKSHLDPMSLADSASSMVLGGSSSQLNVEKDRDQERDRERYLDRERIRERQRASGVERHADDTRRRERERERERTKSRSRSKSRERRKRSKSRDRHRSRSRSRSRDRAKKSKRSNIDTNKMPIKV